MLAERQEVYEKYKAEREPLKSYPYKTEKDYKRDFAFLKEVDSIALQQARKNLTIAFTNFFGLPKWVIRNLKPNKPVRPIRR